MRDRLYIAWLLVLSTTRGIVGKPCLSQVLMASYIVEFRVVALVINSFTSEHTFGIGRFFGYFLSLYKTNNPVAAVIFFIFGGYYYVSKMYIAAAYIELYCYF